MSSIFLAGAVWHIANWELAQKKVVLTGVEHPELILIAATLLMVCGGICILIGFLTSLGAVLLVAEVVLTACIFNQFWTLTGLEMQLSMLGFLKNMALCGGLLFLMASGPGKISVDHRARLQQSKH